MRVRLIKTGSWLLLGDPAALFDARHLLASIILLIAWLGSTILGLLSIAHIDPRDLGDAGLIEIAPVELWICHAALGVGFTLAIAGRFERSILPALHLGTLAFLLHGVPAVAYETLRYSWAWKHIGVVDYILRHGGLGTNEAYLAAYHNWPALFVISAAALELSGAPIAALIEVARFFPLILAFSYIAVLAFLLRRLSADWRLIWLAIWCFLTANWVGQDYYSPQGVAFLLYLIVIALCLGPLRTTATWLIAPRSWLARQLSRAMQFTIGGLPEPSGRNGTAAKLLAAGAVLLLIVTIVAMHQLTPAALVIALVVLAATGQLSVGYAVFAAIASAIWIFFIASPYTAVLLPTILAEFGSTKDVILERLTDTSRVSGGQMLVVWGDRLLSGGIAAMAVIGALRRIINGKRDGLAALLAFTAIPAALVTSYGGEVAFRVYLFALPFMSFLAAAAFFPSAAAGRSPSTYLFMALLCLMLVPGFILANNGKDRQYWFSKDEIAAASWLFTHAPAPSLIIEGGRNYPSQFQNYENFTYVPLDEEPKSSRDAVFANPVATLREWLGDVAFKSSFVILTRSQIVFDDDLGRLPRGFLGRIHRALRESPDFKVVYATPDAVVFSLRQAHPDAGPQRTPGP